MKSTGPRERITKSCPPRHPVYLLRAGGNGREEYIRPSKKKIDARVLAWVKGKEPAG